jgi:hypothetical protein
MADGKSDLPGLEAEPMHAFISALLGSHSPWKKKKEDGRIWSCVLWLVAFVFVHRN